MLLHEIISINIEFINFATYLALIPHSKKDNRRIIWNDRIMKFNSIEDFPEVPEVGDVVTVGSWINSVVCPWKEP